jgi:hypothetical protein
MNMGGGENYHLVTSGTPTQVEDTNAQQIVNTSEQQETGKTIGTTEPAAPSGSAEEENFIKNAEVKKDTDPTSQNVSTETASVSPLPESIGTSKPEDTTSEETTQQTAVQETQVTSQQIWEYEQSIKKEEAGKTPLVCLTEDIQELYQEYEQGSEVYRQKIMVCYLLLCINKPSCVSDGLREFIFIINNVRNWRRDIVR